MNNNENRSMDNLREGLSQHAKFLTQEERKAELRERGINVDEFLAEAHSIIAHHQKEHRLAWMKVADAKQSAFSNAENKFISWVGKRREEIIAAFDNLVNSTGPQHTLAFRNKTDLTTEDMAKILDDYERLRLNKDGDKPSTAK